MEGQKELPLSESRKEKNAQIVRLHLFISGNKPSASASSLSLKMLRNLIALRAKQAAQRLKKSLASLSDAVANNASSSRRAPVPVPVRVPRQSPSSSSSPFHRSVRNYSTNPFNPFTLSRYMFRIGQSFWFKQFYQFNPFNPMNPLNRHKWFRQFNLVRAFIRGNHHILSRGQRHLLFRGGQQRFIFRSHSVLANSVWNFSAFRFHHHHQIGRSIIQSKAFFMSGLYKAAFPQTSSRLFTTYACGPGPIPGFSIQITSETIKNLAISFRTLFNLDNAYKPVTQLDNKFHPYRNQSKNGSVKSGIRLNQSLSARHTAKTLAIGGEYHTSDDSSSVSLDLSIIHGCYVDFPIGADLSIPSMTFLTEEILSEINANLTYITRRINELKQDFKNLSELGELPIKYIAQENVLRVYFPNCDYDKLEVLLREKNIVGGIIYENKKGPINPVNQVVNTLTGAAASAAVVETSDANAAGTTSGGITETDLISSLYQSRNSGSSESSEGSSALFEDDVLSSYGGSASGRGVHPLSDAEVIRIGDYDNFSPPSGPITISDSSGDFHWVERQF